jgi:hypothetical protein
MYGTAMKAKSPHGCLFIFVGNMYPTKHSILRKLKTNPNWLKFIVGAINSNGESIWEDLQPISQLVKELENDIASGHPEIFISEVLNDENAQANNIVDLSKLPAWKVSEGDFASGKFIVIDPSTDKAKADFVAVGYFEVHHGFPHLMEAVEERLSPLQTVEVALVMALKHNCRVVAVEGTAYQSTFNYWAKFICNQRGIMGIHFVEVYPGSTSKITRIVNMLKAYGRGEVFVSPKEKSKIHLQIVSYNIMKRDNTDGLLDLLTYAPKVMEEFGEFIHSLNVIEDQTFGSLDVILNNTPF